MYDLLSGRISRPSIRRPMLVLDIEWLTSALIAPDASLVTISVSLSIVLISTVTPYFCSNAAITSGFT
ncbi:MAG: hypothetical protein R2713_23100 [Ilumatobacteraceae bacterium]